MNEERFILASDDGLVQRCEHTGAAGDGRASPSRFGGLASRAMRGALARSVPLRALALVPLLAVGVDQARAVVWCGPDAQSCLEAAGRGWIGAWGIALVALYSLALALLVVRGARSGPRPSFLRLWAVGSAGVAAACGGQALIASALGGQQLGGGWLALLVLCVAAGALLALVLRAAPELPGAPRPTASLTGLAVSPTPPALRRGFAIARQARDRAPPPLTI